jgi:hypothetical protein
LKPDEEKSSTVIASLLFLAFDVAAYGGIAVHTMLSRRRYVGIAEEMNRDSFLIDFFVFTPGPIYAAAFLLLVVCLIVKEVAVERKETTLRINLAALIGAVALFLTFLWTVQWPFEERSLQG